MLCGLLCEMRGGRVRGSTGRRRAVLHRDRGPIRKRLILRVEAGSRAKQKKAGNPGLDLGVAASAGAGVRVGVRPVEDTKYF